MTQVKAVGTIAMAIIMAVSAIAAVSVFQYVGNSGVLGSGGPQNSYGILEGSVSIGPCCPVEQVNSTCCSPDTYTSRSLVLTQSFFSPATYVPLSADGSFDSNVAQGTYSVTLTNCLYLGCLRTFPQKVMIYAGRTTILNVSIDTGIR